MSSQKIIQPVKYVTDATFRKEMKQIREEIRNTVAEGINATLDVMRQMFKDQDLRNDAKFVTKDELKEGLRELRRENLDYKDALMTELKAIREELTTSGYRQREHSNQLEDHEIRITAVEGTLHLAT